METEGILSFETEGREEKDSMEGCRNVGEVLQGHLLDASKNNRVLISLVK